MEILSFSSSPRTTFRSIVLRRSPKSLPIASRLNSCDWYESNHSCTTADSMVESVLLSNSAGKGMSCALQDRIVSRMPDARGFPSIRTGLEP